MNISIHYTERFCKMFFIQIYKNIENRPLRTRGQAGACPSQQVVTRHPAAIMETLHIMGTVFAPCRCTANVLVFRALRKFPADRCRVPAQRGTFQAAVLWRFAARPWSFSVLALRATTKAGSTRRPSAVIW